ncbi:hypothetical protein CHCC15325_4217 [Bacillus licheniformis]|nr:hypothetical protein B4091_3755 [Bacillus licheniformis]KYC98483.1 hypothetical protein B4164_3519 [Bacillus licheniformis]OLF94013.1 hypothetical protein B4094_1968 [Bacillus licheniformis]OLF96283.1 hypothetical protein B4089_0698 [Bacillus licheniformis]TWJ45963.1 hypothetical protein CHCC5025_1614 [Bacillus licheniformis]
MIYYQKIKKKGVYPMKTTSTHRLESTCTFCSGKGYFQLLLGGSETCSNCKGTGKDRSSQLSND